MTTIIQLFYDIVIPDSNKTKNILSIIILVFISLSFTMYGIEVGEPHVDIYQLRGVFEKTWYELISDFSTPSGLYGGFHAPIYFLLGKAWGSIFGNDVIQLRIFSVVAHVLLVVVSWVKFPTISLNKNIFSRFLFSMLISISPAFIWWAQTAKYNMWFYSISTITIITALSFIQRGGISQLVLFSSAIAIMIYTHYFGFIIAAAQYILLSIIGLIKKSKVWFIRLIISIILTGIFVSPILTIVYDAAQQRSEEGYHFSNQKIKFTAVIRGMILDWNFGHSLISDYGNVEKLTLINEHVSKFRLKSAMALLKGEFALTISAFLCFGLSFVFSISQILRDREKLLNAAYIISIPFLCLLLSYLGSLSFRFSYCGVGIWCFLAFYSIGWSNTKHLWTLIANVLFVVYIFSWSLTNYYQKLEYRYPGFELVNQYLIEEYQNGEKVIIDRWILDHRDPEKKYLEIPKNVNVSAINKLEEILPILINDGKAMAFLAGDLDRLTYSIRDFSKVDNITFSKLKSWISLQQNERSLHVFQLTLN